MESAAIAACTWLPRRSCSAASRARFAASSSAAAASDAARASARRRLRSDTLRSARTPSERRSASDQVRTRTNNLGACVRARRGRGWVLTAVGLLVGEVADDGEELLRGVAARRRRSCSHWLRESGPCRGRPFWKLLERVRSGLGWGWGFVSRLWIWGRDGRRRGERNGL